MSVDCVKGRTQDDHGICTICNGAGCPMRKWRALFDASYTVIIEAQTEEDALRSAEKHCRRGFDFANLIEVK